MNWDVKCKCKKVSESKLDSKLLGKGEYEAMLERTKKIKPKVRLK
jgi:hypothetical protein